MRTELKIEGIPIGLYRAIEDHMQSYAGTKISFSAVTDPSSNQIPKNYNITLEMDNLRVSPTDQIRCVKGLLALLEKETKSLG